MVHGESVEVREGIAYKGVAFTGLEGEFLVVHGESVEVREGIGGTGEGRVDGSIHLVEACGYGFSLLGHASAVPNGKKGLVGFMWERRGKGVAVFIGFHPKHST